MLAAIPFRYVCTYYVGQIRSGYQLNLGGRLYYLKENRVAIAPGAGDILGCTGIRGI